MVLDHKFSQQWSDGLINEVGPLVTCKTLGAPKMSDNIFEYELGGSVYSAIFNWCNFSPSGKVICGCNNVVGMGVMC